MQWLRRLFIAVLLLNVSIVLFAQTPQPVTRALQELNALTGQNYALGNIGYSYREFVRDANQTCGNAIPVGTLMYEVLFDTDLNSDFEWNIVVASDLSVVAVCNSPLPPPPANTAPTAIPQPTATPASCAGLAPLLSIGQTGRVMPGDPNIVRQLPDKNSAYVGEIPAGTEFMVTDGPRCADGFTWWQINTGSIVGWTVEGSNGTYYLEVATAPVVSVSVPFTSPQAVCDPQLPPRLWVGLAGAVSTGDANNVRETASTSAALLFKMPAANTFMVEEGPVCAEGYSWWKVRYSDGKQVGWTVEGANGKYFLEPNLMTYAPISGGVALAQVGSFTFGGQPLPIVSNELYFNSTRGLFAHNGNTTTIYQLIATPDDFPPTMESHLGAFVNNKFYDTPVGRVRTDLSGNYALYLLNSPDGNSAVVFDSVCFIFNADYCQRQSPLDFTETLLLNLPEQPLFSIGSQHTLAVADTTANTVTIYHIENGAPLTVVAKVAVPEMPTQVTLDVTDKLYVRSASGIYGFSANTYEGSLFVPIANLALPFAISADGAQLAYVDNTTIQVVDTVTGQPLKALSPVTPYPYQALAYSPRTSTLVALTGQNGDADSYGLYTYDTSNDRNFYQPLNADYGNATLLFNTDGRLLFVGSDSVPVSIWANHIP